ncbi:MAG TPA: tetratricopeptide repeat protein, partial [Allosphingosinicella sp.]|nr:tetratricopeptide repeat protein [Allosphingosinicella sp.]
MRKDRRLWLVAAAGAVAAGLALPALAQSVQAGVEAWQAGDHAAAVRNWRPLAERGDADAQFNLGHAYRLGRGVPQNMAMAEQLYERAARAGHVEAQAMYGLILFQNGRRQEAMPYVQRAAERGDARAQYVYGTALFNGDVVGRDWPRAYAFVTRAAAQGLPYAESQLREMDRHLSEQDRSRGVELARAMDREAPGALASADPPPPAVTRRPPRVAV